MTIPSVEADSLTCIGCAQSKAQKLIEPQFIFTPFIIDFGRRWQHFKTSVLGSWITPPFGAWRRKLLQLHDS